MKSAGGNLIVLDFFATWCGPCKEIAPKLDQMAEEFANVVFLKIDAADNEECVNYILPSSNRYQAKKIWFFQSLTKKDFLNY